VFLYPLAFQASTILFICSYFVASQYEYEGLAKGDDKDKLAHKRFKTFFRKYHFMMVWHAVELVYGIFLLGTLGESTCEADGSDWILGTGVFVVFNHVFEIMHLMGSAQSFGCQKAIFDAELDKTKEARKK
jgi:hypothetical protein